MSVTQKSQIHIALWQSTILTKNKYTTIFKNKKLIFHYTKNTRILLFLRHILA